MPDSPVPEEASGAALGRTVQPWTPHPAPTQPVPYPDTRQADLRNILLLVAGWILLLWLLPPQHEYPILDDWIYADSVRHQLATGAFAMPDRSQANLVGLTLWGTLWSQILGYSYTTLTYSTLALALPGLLAFYGLARALRVPPGGACLGTALLAVNPLFLHFSYSFMTDVPFVSLMLCACLGYVYGLQGRGAGWLWLAGFCAGWGFLIRQFAGLIPVAFLSYVALDALRTRRVRLDWWLGVAVVPGMFLAGWWLWSRNIPPSGAMLWAAGRRAAFLWKGSWLPIVLLRMLAILPLAALSAWTAVRIRRKRWWLVAFWAVVLAGNWYVANNIKQDWLDAIEPPFTFQFGPISLDLPQKINTFVGYGNLLRVTGFDFFEYHQQGLWSPEAWRLVFVFATGPGVLLLAKMSDGFLHWLGTRNVRGRLTPLTACYLAGFIVFVISMALPSDFFDRYLLGFLPFIILFMVRGAITWGRWAWRYSIAALAGWGLFVILLQADFIDHDNARWQAGQWLLARAHPVHVGYDWDNVKGFGNGTYEVADVPLPGFRVEARFPYTSRLSGLMTRYVLAQARADQPPLPRAWPP